MLISTLMGGCASNLEYSQNHTQAQDHYQRGVNYLNAGAPELAVQEFLEALERDRENARIYNALGLAYHMQRKYPLAEEQFQQAITIDPQFSEAHLNYSALLIAMKQWDKAIINAENALTNPAYQTPERAYHNIGYAYYQKGLLTVAISYFQKALAYNPSFPYTNYYLGQIYLQLQKFPDAIREFQAAIQRDPAYWNAYYQLGLAYDRNGERQKAEEIFQRLIALAPRSVWAHESQAYLESRW